jgi:hypothetical protein
MAAGDGQPGLPAFQQHATGTLTAAERATSAPHS